MSSLREPHPPTGAEVKVCREQLEQTLADLTKQRTMLNVRKKKRKEVYEALADAELLAPAYQLYTEGFSGMESEAGRYQAAVQVLDACGVSREQLRHEKAVLYDQLAEVNREIRQVRKQIKLCDAILKNVPIMEQEIRQIEGKEVKNHERRRR